MVAAKNSLGWYTNRKQVEEKEMGESVLKKSSAARFVTFKVGNL